MNQQEKEYEARQKFQIAQKKLSDAAKNVHGLKAVNYEREYAVAYQGLVKLGLAPQIKKKYRTF